MSCCPRASHPEPSAEGRSPASCLGSGARRIKWRAVVWKSCAAFALLVLLRGAFGPAGLKGAEARNNMPAAFASTNLIITSTNGCEFSGSSLVFRGDVRVLEAQIYIECDLLTMLLQTNSNATGPRIRPETSGGLTNVDARLDRIVAETNVLIMTKDATLIGDRAVYTQSNEMVVVTGLLVIAETAKSYSFGTHFEFDLKTSQGSIVGPNTTVLPMDSTPGSTNKSQHLGIGPDRRPRSGVPREGTPKK
jgi:hypothetical protein